MNSSATGCFIVTSCDVGTIKFMAVPINDGAGTVSGLESGICLVLVYDPGEKWKTWNTNFV